MPIELNIKGGSKEILEYLRGIKEHLVDIFDTYEKVEDKGKKSIGSVEKEHKEYNKEAKRTNGLIEDIEESIKMWASLQKKATTVEGIQKYNKKIAEARLHLNELKNTGVPAIEKVNKTAEKGASVFNSFEKKIIGVVTAYKALGAIKELNKTAVSLDILDQKVKSVFGNYTSTIDNVAKETASDLGLTQSQYKIAAADAGDLLKQIGFTKKEAAVLSTSLVGLSGVMSEWSIGKYNAAETSKILNKTLLGEYERIKELNVEIKDADVKARLLAKGKGELTGMELKQAKAMEILEMIYERTGDAQSAYGKNSESLSRIQGRLTASLLTVKENLSEDLIPVFSKFFGWAERNMDSLKKTAKILVAVSAGTLSYKAAVYLAANGTNIWTIANKALTTSFRTLAVAEKTTLIGALAGVIVTAATALLLFAKRTRDAKNDQKDFNDELEYTKQLKEGKKSLEERAKVMDKMSQSELKRFKSDIEEQIRLYEEFTTKKLLAEEEYNKAVQNLNDLSPNSEDYIEMVKNISKLKGETIPVNIIAPIDSSVPEYKKKQAQEEISLAKQKLDRLSNLEQDVNIENLRKLKETLDAKLGLHEEFNVELEELKLQTMKDGLDKDLAQEDIRYEKEKEKYKDNAEALEVVEEIHNQKIYEIVQKYNDLYYKELEEKAKKQKALREKEALEEQKTWQEKLNNFDLTQQTEKAIQETNWNVRISHAKGNKKLLEEIEKEKTLFDLQQQKKRLEYILQFGNLKNDTEIKLYEALIKQLKSEMSNLTNEDSTTGKEKGFNFYSDILGIDPDDPEGAKVISALKKFKDKSIEIFSSILDAQVEAAERRTEIAQNQVDELQQELDREAGLKEQGLANNYNLKLKELNEAKAIRDKALKDEEKARKAQMALDSAVQLSNLITSSTQIFKELSKIPVVGIPLAISLIGTMFAAFAASKIQAAKLTKVTNLRKGRTGIPAGEIKGKSHEEGGVPFEVEGGEYHSITPKNKTKKHFPLLEAIRTGTDWEIASVAVKNLLDASNIKVDHNIPKELREKQEEARKIEMIQVLSGVSSTGTDNSLLKRIADNQEKTPVIDTVSDPDYVIYSYPNGDKKLIRKR